jgi:hypothetical protein
MKYRKKPVVIEAYKLPALDSDELMPDWATKAYLDRGFGKTEAGMTTQTPGYWVKTLEGTMSAAPGEWLIRGVKGELYFCKPDIFEMTYDAVPE